MQSTPNQEHAMQTATTRTIKIIVSDGREEIITVAAGPNAYTRAHIHSTLKLRGESVRYEELINGEWLPYAMDVS